MNRVTRDRIIPSARIQSLEDRRMLTVFGTVWPNQRDLAISFPNDGVQIGKHQNEINEMLDVLASRQQWQELALRAYQTWAVHADINVGLRNDYNNGFGTPGMIVGDPRFGEFRIGAYPQEGLVANSVPFQAIAGTYSGDLILNSNERFTLHDWAGGQGPHPSTIVPGDRDLFSVLLHETGNTLGLDDTMLGSSVMFRQYTVPKGVLTQSDIDSIQSLYGQRSDPYEQVDNGQLQFASSIPTPVGMDPQVDVIQTRGSLLAGDDVDYYKILPVSGSDTVTISVRAAGVSLLQSRLEILDASGQVLAQTSAASVFDNDNELTITGIANQAELYVRVSAVDPADVYSVGDYFVEIDYRDQVTRASDPRPGSYDSGPDALFTNYELIDPEVGTNDNVGAAFDLQQSGNPHGGRYEFQSSVGSVSDVDFLKITAPATPQGRLLVHLSGVGANHPELRMHVVDAAGQPMGASARLRSDGTFTIEVADPQASQEYFIRVSVDPNSAVGVGNYVAVAEFETPPGQMHDLASGDLVGDTDRFIRWTADKSKLFRFDLSASSPDANQAVRMTIYDAHTREIKGIAVAQAGVTRSALAWLQQGDYIIRFSAIATGGLPVTTVSYTLEADGLSDDQDTDNEDPGDNPYNDPYDYYGGSYDPYYYYDPGSSYYYYYYNYYYGG